jgi:hypothetical protein
LWRLRPGVAYLAGETTVVAFGEPTAAGASEVRLTLQTQAQQDAMSKMLADNFLQQFRVAGSADVKALLQDE